MKNQEQRLEALETRYVQGAALSPEEADRIMDARRARPLAERMAEMEAIRNDKHYCGNLTQEQAVEITRIALGL